MTGFATHRPVRVSAVLVGAAALFGAAAACGDDAADRADPTDEVVEPTDEGADNGPVGETRRGSLQLLGNWTEIHPAADGSVEVTVDLDGTTVRLTVTGLDPDTEYPAHLHDAPCEADPPGGDHWEARPDGDLAEPDHLHTYVITDGQGDGEMVDTSPLVADDRAMSVVVHAAGANDRLEDADTDRIFCADLTE